MPVAAPPRVKLESTLGGGFGRPDSTPLWNPSQIVGDRLLKGRSTQPHRPVSAPPVPVATQALSAVPPVSFRAPVHRLPPAAPLYTPSRRPTRDRSDLWLRLSRGLAVAAVAVLVYAGWNSVGTDLYAAWSQARLASELAQSIEDSPTILVQAPDFVTGRLPAPEAAVPTLAAGSPLGTISIPEIGVDHTVVVGTGVDELKKGPGWESLTSFPGQPGNTVISGHRTTYGAPFNRLDELKLGDLIEVTSSSAGKLVYEVRDVFIVSPDDAWVAAPTDGVRLTLTTCHPKGSARQRLIVQAELVDGPNVDKAVAGPDWTRSAPLS